jgi:mono/diheme cytochrome c family protein
MNRKRLVAGITFLLSMTALTTGEAALVDDGPARKLINSQGCKACHSLEADGGTAAPGFEEIRASFSRQEIRQQLINREHVHGNGRIPDFSNLTDDEIESLVVFIQPKP